MKSFAKLLFALFLFWTTSQFCHRQTDGFQISKISSYLPFQTEWEIRAPSLSEKENLRNIFSQPFTYLDSGGQCYAFLSEDKKTVVKLYKMHHLRQYPFLYRWKLPAIFDSWRQRFLLSQKQKLERVFSSSHLAYTALKEETGLIYLNLNPTSDLDDLELHIVDKIGIRHRLSLSHIPFALQYRADNPFKKLRSQLAHHDLEGGKQTINEIIACLTARYEKGIKDLDPALRRNIGLLQDRAIAIDIGAFFSNPTPLSAAEKQQELFNDTRRMRRWLQKRSLVLMNHLDQLIQDYNNPST